MARILSLLLASFVTVAFAPNLLADGRGSAVRLAAPSKFDPKGINLLIPVQALAPSEESEAAMRKRIAERLSKLNQSKLDALMSNIGKEAPKDFYACLCSTIWRAGHVGVSYRSGKCHFSGFGEWDEGLPHDPGVWASCVDSQRFEDGSTLVDVLAGEVKQRRDKRKKEEQATVPSKPGKTEIDQGPASSVDSYGKLLGQNLTALRLKGYPMNKIEQLNAMMRRHIMQLNQPGKLPSFWEPMGIPAPPASDSTLLDIWRKSMLEKYDQRFLGWLATGDPKTIMDGLRQTSQALGNYDSGMKLAAEGALDEVAGNQKFVEDVMSAIPVVGDTMDVVAVAGAVFGNGDWTLSGDEVTGFDAMLRFIAIAGPVGLDKIMSRSKSAARVARPLRNMTVCLGCDSLAVMRR